MHALNTGKHFEWLAKTQSCQLSHDCGSALSWAAGLQEHPQGSGLSSASRNKEGKSEGTFSAGSFCGSPSLCLPQHRLESGFPSAPLWDPCGDTLMAPGDTCSENHQDKWGDLWITHCSVPLIWPNIAHQSFWKTAVSQLKPESCEKLFPPGGNDDAQGLFECLCLLWTQALSQELCSCMAEHNTHRTQREYSHWQWQPNRS